MRLKYIRSRFFYGQTQRKNNEYSTRYPKYKTPNIVHWRQSILTPRRCYEHTQKLNALGFNAGDETRGLIDHDLDSSIRNFQSITNLKQDGNMKPKGETDMMLNNILHVTTQTNEKTPPTPQRKPMTPKEKSKERLKKRQESQKELLEGISKKVINRILFLKDLVEKTYDIEKEKDGGVI